LKWKVVPNLLVEARMLLKVNRQTINFGGTHYQISNITEVGKYYKKRTFPIPRKTIYALHLVTNSGASNLVTSTDEDFIDKLVLIFSKAIDQQIQSGTYTVNIKKAKIIDNSVNTNKTVLGDNTTNSYSNVTNSTIGNVTGSNITYINESEINDSTLKSVVSRASESYGIEAGKALEEIASHLKSISCTEGNSLFNGFNEELSKQKPNKSVLRSIWDSFIKTLPDTAIIASSLATIAKILV